MLFGSLDTLSYISRYFHSLEQFIIIYQDTPRKRFLMISGHIGRGPFISFLRMLVFQHHSFLDMPNPVWFQILSQTASFGIIFPSGLTIMTVMMYIFRSRIKWNISSMFFLAGIAGWAYGGFNGAQEGWWGTDVYL